MTWLYLYSLTTRMSRKILTRTRDCNITRTVQQTVCHLSKAEIDRQLSLVLAADLAEFPLNALDSPTMKNSRAAGFRSAIVRGVIGNSFWGHSMMGKRMVKAKLRKQGKL